MKAFMLVVWLCSAVWAVDYTWISVSNGTWNVTNNWTPTGFPNRPDDRAAFGDLGLPTNHLLEIMVLDTTVGVLRCSAGLQRNYINFSGVTPRPLVLQAPGTNALIEVDRQVDGGTPALHFQGNANFSVGIPAGLDTVLNNNMADIGCWFACQVTGPGAINKHGTNELRFSVYSPLYTGTVTVYQGNLSIYSADVFTNAADVVVHAGTRLETRGISETTPITLAGGMHYCGAGTNYHRGRVRVAADSWVEVPNPFRIEYWGELSGSHTLTKTNWASVAMYGALSPGDAPAAAGMLTLDEMQGVIEIGAPAAPVTVHIDVLGSGGIPGVDHDQLVLTNFGAALNLANIKVIIHGDGGGPDVTNWFWPILHMLFVWLLKGLKLLAYAWILAILCMCLPCWSCAIPRDFMCNFQPNPSRNRKTVAAVLPWQSAT